MNIAKLAVLADVHGNRWALEAILDELDRRGVQTILDLGDSLYGPLDPAGTARLLVERSVSGIAGNEDRLLVEGGEAGSNPSLSYTLSQLNGVARKWLGGLPAVKQVPGELYACHGTPGSDHEYLLEEVTPNCVRLRDGGVLAERLAGLDAPLILCGHSHLPRLVQLPDGRLIINPGSVGLPAYQDTHPWPHAMESGSPHARCAILSRLVAGWQVDLVAVPYDVNSAVQAARRNGRPDWANWLASGRA